MTHLPARIGLEPDVRDVLLQQMRDENAALHAENGRLRAENERLRSEGSAKEAEIERQQAEIATLQARFRTRRRITALQSPSTCFDDQCLRPMP
jgi:regulator of replication initiation timing